MRAGLRVTQQPTLEGTTGSPLGLVFAEHETEDRIAAHPFRGLRAFIQSGYYRADSPAERALAALEKDLGVKAARLGADAVVNVRVNAIRGSGQGGKRIKFSAVGTAIRLP